MQRSATSARINLVGWMATRKARKIWVNGNVSRQLMPRITCDSSAMGGAPFPAGEFQTPGDLVRDCERVAAKREGSSEVGRIIAVGVRGSIGAGARQGSGSARGGSDSSGSSTGIWYRPSSQRPRSTSLQRSLQKGKYRPPSGTGVLQMGQGMVGAPPF